MSDIFNCIDKAQTRTSLLKSVAESTQGALLDITLKGESLTELDALNRALNMIEVLQDELKLLNAELHAAMTATKEEKPTSAGTGARYKYP